MNFALVVLLCLASVLGSIRRVSGSPYLPPVIRTNVLAYTFSGNICPFGATWKQCNDYARDVARKQDRCTGYALNMLRLIYFVRCDPQPRCEGGSIFVPEDTSANRMTFPHCCAFCKPFTVNHGTTMECPPHVSRSECQEHAIGISRKQDRCTGFSRDDESGKIVFQRCMFTPKCDYGMVLVPEDNGPERSSFPNCCTRCEAPKVDQDSTLDCPPNSSKKQCEEYAKFIAREQDSCVGYSLNETGKVTFQKCNITSTECSVGTLLFPEDHSANRPSFPGCCPTCMTPRVYHGSELQCNLQLSQEECYEHAKAISENQNRCTGYTIDSHGMIYFQQCPVIECAGKYIDEDVSLVNRKQFPQCCAKCVV